MLPSRQLNMLSRSIIGCAMEVHRRLGPGLLESLYEDAFCYELTKSRLQYERQKLIRVYYRDIVLSSPLKIDVLVANEVIVEVKSVEAILDVHEAQLLSYLRAARKNLGLLINFNVSVLKIGI